VRVLVGCERSGVIREAFRRLGHDAWSCDLEPAEDYQRHHIQEDVRQAMLMGWDLFIVHPECTYLSGSGLHWYHRRAGRPELVEEAVAFAQEVWNAPIQKVCMENPVGYLSRRIRKPDQIIQPYEFGEDASKATCLWLSGLPLLKPTKYVEGRCVGEGRDGRLIYRWSNQTDSGQNRLAPSPDRPMQRARTYPGIAAAMAEQWGAT
jgi:hypothetical protein